ncbi:MAG TPA: hypothetical protein IAC09_08865 [Candidatus Cryptobacteroides intestinipullorum]|nr:hypothetical protein [Candidatus Cryptobacteroides intestinipullorum]
MITEQDYYNIIDTAREDGIAIGIAQGRTEGLIEVAKSMKTMGIPEETISRATGLSKREIEAL